MRVTVSPRINFTASVVSFEKGQSMSAQIKWDHVDSSNVEAVAFDEPSSTLCVKFLGGGLYSYSNVSLEVYSALQYADSVGQFLNRVIKPLHTYTKHMSESDLLSHLSH